MHIALSTDQLLSRVWIINEFAERKQAGKYTTLLTAGGSEGKRINQLRRKWKYVRCQKIKHDYYESLQATVEEDKRQIREKLLKVYGTKDEFNEKITQLVESLDSFGPSVHIFVGVIIAGVIIFSYYFLSALIYNGHEPDESEYESEPVPFHIQLIVIAFLVIFWPIGIMLISMWLRWFAGHCLRYHRYSPLFRISFDSITFHRFVADFALSQVQDRGKSLRLKPHQKLARDLGTATRMRSLGRSISVRRTERFKLPRPSSRSRPCDGLSLPHVLK
jgi:hypothetical protein